MSGKIKVKFINGQEDKFHFEPQSEPAMFAKKLREFLTSNALVLQLDGEVEIIPLANVQSITVIPAREKILETVALQGAIVAKRSI